MLPYYIKFQQKECLVLANQDFSVASAELLILPALRPLALDYGVPLPNEVSLAG